MVELKCPNTKNRYELLYVFHMNKNPNWRINLVKACFKERIIVPKQGSMSDFDYFKVLIDLYESTDHVRHDDYFLLLDKKPIARLYVMYRSIESVDLSCFVVPAFQHQGYATEATKLIETELFLNQHMKYITIMDKTESKVSSRIAENLGYDYIKEKDYYQKNNPYIKEQGVKLWE